LEDTKVANNALQAALTPNVAQPAILPYLSAVAHEIKQAGIVVGKAFGARRSPTDATIFEFEEITNSQQFNYNAPFEYQGHTLRLIHAETITGLNVSRPQDGRIISRVKAKILKLSGTS
jgi:hypothetical protein